MMTNNSYPGDMATPRQLYGLALQYHTAAESMFSDALTKPARLLSLQAVEGYLIAYARHIGRTNAEVRGSFHDIVKLADIGADAGLALRSRVHLHLTKIVKNREYLVVRYGPEMDASLSQVTELEATLNELRQKVGASIGVKP